MKSLSKKYFILLAGLLFVTSVSLDPLQHEYFESEDSKIECQFCKNKVSKPIQFKVGIAKISLSAILIVVINEDFISYKFNNFYSRAPPKI
jgi:hypothetical protein